MSEIEDLRALLRAVVQRPPPPPAEMRVAYENLGKSFPMPDGAISTATTLGGVPALNIAPKDARTRGVLLYLHGGGYEIGSAASHAPMIAQIAAAAGIIAYALDYRLAPETPFPGAVEDAVAAYRALLASGVKPGEIVIAGDSAGGGLTLATALALKQRKLPQPAGLFCISPWADLAQSGASFAAVGDTDLIVSKGELDRMAASYLAGAATTDPLASPLHGDFAGLAPLLIHVGSDEVLLSDATRVAEAAGLARVPVTLVIAPDMPHVWHFFWVQLTAARAAIADAGAWIGSRIAA